jgi:signal transduction histidine kinase
VTTRELSIKTKITLFMVIFISAVLASFSLLVLNTGRGIIIDEVRQRGLIISKNLAANISGYLLTRSTLDSIQLLARARESKGVVYALVEDGKGAVIAHNDTSLIGKVFAMEKTGKSGAETQWADAKVSGQKVLDFTAPVTASKGVFLGNVHLGISYATINEMLWRMYFVLIIISIISLIVAIAGAIVLGIAFTRPIEALADGARKMGEGDLDHRVNIKSSDEFGRLAEALNTMAGDLKKAHAAEIDKQKFEVEKLREIGEIKSNFISIVSHELRTPLAVIKGIISFLLKGALGAVNAKQKDFIETMSNNAKRLELIVNDLMDISMIEKGKFPVNKERFDLNALIKELVADMTGLMAEHSITLVFEENMVPGENAGDIFINADRGRIAQAVTNLISNAVKFSSQKTSVKIGILTGDFGPMDQKTLEMIQSSGGCVMIYVKDQGLGLERDQLEKIFERFYQVENANTRSHSGIGMGLSITKNIVELHDGAIWAESEGKGKGTTFKLMLPKGA